MTEKVDASSLEIQAGKESPSTLMLDQIKEAILSAPVEKDRFLHRIFFGGESDLKLTIAVEEVISEEELRIIDRDLFKFFLDLRSGEIKHENISEGYRQLVPLPLLWECDSDNPNSESTLSHELRHANKIIIAGEGKEKVEIRLNYKWVNSRGSNKIKVLSNDGRATTHVDKDIESSYSEEDLLSIIFAPVFPGGSDFLVAQKKCGLDKKLTKGQVWSSEFVEEIVPERHKRFFEKKGTGYEFVPTGILGFGEEFKKWAYNNKNIVVTDDDRIMFPHILTETREGSIETGRTLGFYTQELFFEPELLQDKKILNLGSGSSNLGRDLEKSKVGCEVVDLDFNFDPYLSKALKPVRTKVSQLINRYMTGEKKRKTIRKVMGTEGRDMLQGDMVALPFPDHSFDFIFALHSTYQLPSEKKKLVFEEMMRVANTIHISPVLKEDIHFFIELLEDEYQDFEIVLSYPPDTNMFGENRFVIKDDSDYQKILNGELGEDRIYEPRAEAATYKKDIWGRTHAYVDGGYTLILRRKNS